MENSHIFLMLNNLILCLCAVVVQNEEKDKICKNIGSRNDAYLVSIDYVPFLVWVALQSSHHKKFGQGKICHGTVITQRVVLTAAHCYHIPSTFPARYKDPSLFIVVAGGSYVDHADRYTREFAVQEIVGHSEYDENKFINDIAMLLLNGFVARNLRTVKIIDLAVTPLNSTDYCHVTGWGPSIKYGNQTVLQHLGINIWHREDCRKMHSRLSDSFLCAGYPDGGIGLCLSDYGGPLVCKNRLAGILAWDKHSPRAFGLFTNISHHLKWIQKINATFDYKSLYEVANMGNVIREFSILDVRHFVALFILITYGF